MLEELIVENFNRFEVILNPQLGNVHRGGKYLELKLIYVRAGLGPVLIRSFIVIIVIIVLLLLLLLVVIIILIQRFPARHSQG